MRTARLIAGRNPASRRWPDHNPNLIEIASGAWAHLDEAPTIHPPRTLSAWPGPTHAEIATACQRTLDLAARRLGRGE